MQRQTLQWRLYNITTRLLNPSAQLIPTFVVDVEAVILTATGDVVSVCGQANKVLLVNVT